MNKIVNPNSLGRIISLRSYIITTMKVFLLMISIGLSSVYANSTYAQTKMDINVKDIKLEDLFKEIQSKSEFIFFYKDNTIDKNKRISIHLRKATLSKILKKAFSNTDLSFKIDDRQVVIKKSPSILSVTTIEKSQDLTISGTVSDADGSLPGASVVVKGTTNGTQTDFDGNYTIENVAPDATLVISYIGFKTKEVAVNGQSTFNVILVEDAAALDEVVIIGYGSTTKKEITSAVTVVTEEDFNKGTVNDAASLLQGKVAGLSIYNKGGDPNSSPTIRLRGISTVGANTSPLVVVDGVVGASLDNVDPSDIASINVLKDGSASAIYGTRGSSGVILVTTKKGRIGGTKVNYNGSIAASSIANSIDIMSADEFISAGLTNLGSKTDWIEEVTQTGITEVHNISISGGHDNTTYRFSANKRDVEGIVKNTGFDQFNTRANVSTRMLNDKLKVNFNTSYTKKESDFGSGEVMKYSVLYNPTAPVFGIDAPFEFNEAQFGGYFETLGLFDSYNPVAIQNLLKNKGSRTEFNYNVDLNYDFTEHLSAKMIYGAQDTKNLNVRYAPTTLLRGGNATSPTRKGNAQIYSDKFNSKLFELYGTYKNKFGNVDLTFTGGYSFQENSFYGYYLELSDFPDTTLDYSNALELSYDLEEAGRVIANSSATNDDRLIAFFGRLNMTFDDAIFFSASLRQEGSSRFGEDEKWGLFPAVGAGVDLNKYLELNNVDLFKFRVGYGVTGAIPGQIGLSQPNRNYSYDETGTGAFFTLLPSRAPNLDLRWEEKAELNFGVEFNMPRFGATLDIYSRDVTDFILEVSVDPSDPIYEGATSQFKNAGDLSTKGFELAVNYDIIVTENLTYNSGFVFSSYKSTLDEYFLDDQKATTGNLGSPGQNSTNMILLQEGGDIGQIWGPVFSGEIIDGVPQFKDLNGDGELITGQDQATFDNADFATLGNGIPDFEIGWTNQLQYGKWQANAFFRGAFGHSLVNTFRAFYEPRISSQSSYNLVNTTLANDEITSAQFSSLYVEKADFVKLDNLSVSYDFDLGDNKYIKGMRLTGSGQNLFVITNYTGSDPEPALFDSANGNVLAPGIDRRTNYFSARTFTLGLNINF
ncbi:MAG: SusC/RagA family TonB-linked outer membrane protein [Cellulophaga sp.]